VGKGGDYVIITVNKVLKGDSYYPDTESNNWRNIESEETETTMTIEVFEE